MTTFTRAQIDAIAIGTTTIAQSIDGLHFGKATPVVSIHAKREDIHGKLFVCGYRDFGGNAQISFSVKEGDPTDSRLTRILNIEDQQCPNCGIGGFNRKTGQCAKPWQCCGQ